MQSLSADLVKMLPAWEANLNSANTPREFSRKNLLPLLLELHASDRLPVRLFVYGLACR